jgi:D-alanine transaminase
MKHLGYYNGAFGEIETMSVPMNDRVCYFGDGVYDASYSRNYKIFALDEHIDRLYRSAAELRIDIHETKAEMREIWHLLASAMTALRCTRVMQTCASFRSMIA